MLVHIILCINSSSTLCHLHRANVTYWRLLKMSSNFVGKSKHPIVFGKQALIFGKHTQIFRKHLPLFRYHVLHFERAEYEQKEPRQEPVFQVLASYSTNFQLSVVYSSTAAWAAANGC